MAESKGSDLKDEAKGLTKDLLSSLGLLEIVLGAVFLYGAWCGFSKSVSAMFPSTGIQVVDIGLLAVAAAYAGKAIDLVAHFVFAINNRRISTGNWFKYYERIKKLVEGQNLAGNTDCDIVETGWLEVCSKDPNEKATYENLRTNIRFVYGGLLVSPPYVYRLHQQLDFTNHWVAFLVGIPLLYVLWFGAGLVWQLNYYQTLATKLEFYARVSTTK